MEQSIGKQFAVVKSRGSEHRLLVTSSLELAERLHLLQQAPNVYFACRTAKSTFCAGRNCARCGACYRHCLCEVQR